MTKTTVDMSVERKLCTLLIMNTEFCKAIIPILKPNLLKTPYAKFVATEVSTFYQTYKVAPEGQIQDIWTAKRAHETDSEALESVGSFLSSLADSYDAEDYKNLQYHVDACVANVRANSVNALTEKLQSLVASGKIDEAEAAVSTYKRVGVPSTEGVSIMTGIDRFEKAFQQTSKSLFRLKGFLGTVAGDFSRGEFSLGLAAMKASKSFYLADIGFAACYAGCKVVHINLEIDEDSLYRRVWKGMNMAPETDCILPVAYFHSEREPTDEDDPNTQYTVMTKNVSKKGVSFSDKKKVMETLKMRNRYGGDIMYLTLPSSATTVEHIESLLDNLAYYNNYVCDVLVVDYPDLLGSRERDYRARMNDIYENLRRVAQMRHIHVAGVSQTNKSGLEGKEMTAADLAEDIRKAAHVSKIIGLFGTGEERQNSRVTVKNLLSREKMETFESACVLQCLDMGLFCLDSKPSSKVL